LKSRKEIEMKRIILFLMVILLAVTGCRKECRVGNKNVPPIDWENYNDVTTVWNNLTHSYKDDIPVGRTIKVAGWIQHVSYEDISAAEFDLVLDSAIDFNSHGIAIRIEAFDIREELQAKFDTCNLKNKCFVKGKVELMVFKTMYCASYSGKIKLENIDNICFEEERSEK
jgi:hypothetical protein